MDRLWQALSSDESAEQCGWLKDRYGLSWQIIPSALPRLLTDPDAAKAKRVMTAMLATRRSISPSSSERDPARRKAVTGDRYRLRTAPEANTEGTPHGGTGGVFAVWAIPLSWREP